MNVFRRIFVLLWLISMMTVLPFGVVSFIYDDFRLPFFIAASMVIVPFFLVFGCFVFTGSTNQVIDFLTGEKNDGNHNKHNTP